jgi:hypothetical protein
MRHSKGAPSRGNSNIPATLVLSQHRTLSSHKPTSPTASRPSIVMASYGTFNNENANEPEQQQQHPVPRVPAPWKLQAESYILFMKLKELPEGIYDPREVEEEEGGGWKDENVGKWMGGLGSVMVVRYSDTPVGMF